MTEMSVMDDLGYKSLDELGLPPSLVAAVVTKTHESIYAPAKPETVKQHLELARKALAQS